MLIGKYVNLER